MKKIKYLVTFFLLIVFYSCHEEPEGSIMKENTLTITIESDRWIYYSISDSTIVGESKIGDSIADKEWFNRTDWDIAFSENGIRTNSGTSGVGKGGIKIENSETSAFSIDTMGVIVPVPLD